MVAKLIAAEIKKFGFDGMVLEVQGAEKHLHDFVTDIYNELNPAGLLVILVIPPFRGQGSFGKQELALFNRCVHRFSLMTYDYSNPNQPGPNSPIEWVKASVDHLCKGGVSKETKAKILVGLNFYGNDFIQGGGGGAILGGQYLELLKTHKPTLEWNEKEAEHMFQYSANGKTHLVYYPTTVSIQRRLDLARSLGVGISVWEIGQGLDDWYSLF